jgi:hypothetical protein
VYVVLGIDCNKPIFIGIFTFLSRHRSPYSFQAFFWNIYTLLTPPSSISAKDMVAASLVIFDLLNTYISSQLSMRSGLVTSFMFTDTKMHCRKHPSLRANHHIILYRLETRKAALLILLVSNWFVSIVRSYPTRSLRTLDIESFWCMDYLGDMISSALSQSQQLVDRIMPDFILIFHKTTANFWSNTNQAPFSPNSKKLPGIYSLCCKTRSVFWRDEVNYRKTPHCGALYGIVALLEVGDI